MRVALRLFQMYFANGDASSSRITNPVFAESHKRIRRIDTRRTKAVLPLVVRKYVLLFGDVVNLKARIFWAREVHPRAEICCAANAIRGRNSDVVGGDLNIETISIRAAVRPNDQFASRHHDRREANLDEVWYSGTVDVAVITRAVEYQIRVLYAVIGRIVGFVGAIEQ
jgi:hypothetical protein